MNVIDPQPGHVIVLTMKGRFGRDVPVATFDSVDAMRAWLRTRGSMAGMHYIRHDNVPVVTTDDM